MSDADIYFRRFKNSLIGELNTFAIGKILSFDPVKMKADIELLPDGDLIKSVPVGMQQTSEFYIRIPYQKGDIVGVVFAQREIDGIMYESNNPKSKRMLAVDDAVVVCGINLFTNNLPSEDADKLVIAEKGGAKITIGNGEIHMTGSKITANGQDLT